MSDSRIQNSKRNIVIGTVRQVISIGLAFASRTMILYLLGEQYLGLSSLFTSILAVLNLADLGFNMVAVYFLYKPIAENDLPQICAITEYLRRTYRTIGLVILVGGIAVLPFLPHLILGSYPADINIYVLYLIYLANTVVTYWFFAYKAVVFTAYQRVDVVDKVYLITSVCAKITQLIVLVLFRNYYLFAILLVLGTLLNNILLEKCSRKMLPQVIPSGEISQSIRVEAGKQMRAMFVGKVGDVARNSCDSIFISSMLGLSMVAVYDNYMYIFKSIMDVVWMVAGAIQASIGNSIVSESKEKNTEDFYHIDFAFTWIIGWCSICLLCLYQPFMLIWMGGKWEMLLSDANVVLLALYFYCVCINIVRNLYVNAVGLFVKIRNWYIIEALSNVVLNLALGYLWGVTGIILATLISVVICNFIARTNILFREYFLSSPSMFYRKHMGYFSVLLVASVLTYLVCGFVRFDGIIGLILRGVLCILVPNGVYYVIYHRTPAFRFCLQLARKIINKQ